MPAPRAPLAEQRLDLDVEAGEVYQGRTVVMRRMIRSRRHVAT
jgi:hypothetical protein